MIIDHANSTYTFIPSGDVTESANHLGLGLDLLRKAQEARHLQNLPAWSMDADFYSGMLQVRVLASENSSIYIFASDELAGLLAQDHRVRMLHCRITLTLADDFYDGVVNYKDHCAGNFNGDLKDDGAVGWPYQKDPSFIAVEPIPVMAGEDKKIHLHTTFEVENKRGIFITGLNGEEHIDDWEEDWKEVKEGDEGRILSLEDAKKIIELRTNWKLVKKQLDSEGEELKLFTQKEVIRPQWDGEMEGLEFNKLFQSRWNLHLGVNDLDDYIYINEQDTPGDYRWISTQPYRINEPIEIQGAIELETEEDGTGRRIPTGNDVPIHNISYSSVYYDSVEGDVSDTNIHPTGNINDASLRYSYGMLADFGQTMCNVTSDLTARLSDKVYIGDISKAAKRNKLSWLSLYKSDGTTENIYVDPKLFNVFFPYYIEAYNSEDIWTEHRYLTAPGDWYAVDYAHIGYDIDEIMQHVFPSINYPLEPDVFHYSNFACNWLLHPFRNNSWSTGLADFFTTARVEFELAHNLDFVFNDLSVNASNLFCDAPSRAILCIREFFANTENATSFAGQRQSWDIKFESTEESPEHFKQDVEHFEALETFDNIPTETSRPLTTINNPNFITEKGDVVIVSLGSAIYAVCDFPEVDEPRLSCSQRWISSEKARTGDTPELAGSTATKEDDIITKRAWPTFLDGDWKYTNIYSAGVTISYLSKFRDYYAKITEGNYPKTLLATWGSSNDALERALNGESIYSDADEDISTRLLPDGTEPLAEEYKMWREEDTPESHMVHCIYRALEAEGYDKHQPVCDIKIEAELFDRYEV